jgi:hypothetical protein
MAKADQKTIRNWQERVEEYKASGLTREAYSKQKGIQVYQLDYWRRKLSRRSKGHKSSSADQWIPLQIADSPGKKDSHIDLWIGSIRVEVRHGFDSQLLAEVLQTVGARC